MTRRRFPPPAGPPRRLVCLDRDGTINREVHHLTRPDQLELLPGAAEGLRALHAAGHTLAVVTNQSVIGRERLDEAGLAAIHRRLAAMLRAEGVSIAGWYHCPHAPNAGCGCRKPAPGLLERAARDLGGTLDGGWMVGDRLSDLQAGRAVGMRTILVTTGYGRTERASPRRRTDADHVAASLDLAASHILSAGALAGGGGFLTGAQEE